MATINKFISARLLMDDGGEIEYPNVFYDALFNGTIAAYNDDEAGMFEIMQEEIDGLEDKINSLESTKARLFLMIKELKNLSPTTALNVARIKKHGDTVQKAEAAKALQILRRLSQEVYPRRIAKPKKAKK